jgi:tetratricopeptide (TPR) repeat protein
MECYAEGLKVSEELGDIYAIAHIYRYNGDISLAKKEYKQALRWYQKSLTIFEKLGANREIRIIKEKIFEV